MMTRSRHIVGVLLAAAVLAGCGGDDNDGSDAANTTSSTTTSSTTTTETTSTTETSRLRPETEDALRTCASLQASFARDLSLGDVDRGGFDDVADTCDAALVQLKTDIGGESALFGMGVALRNELLAQWQLDVAETGEAQPADTGLTAMEAAVQWESEIGDEINELSEE